LRCILQSFESRRYCSTFFNLLDGITSSSDGQWAFCFAKLVLQICSTADSARDPQNWSDLFGANCGATKVGRTQVQRAAAN
jgi:hypothetical protein